MRSWDMEIEGKYYKLDGMSNLILVPTPDEKDNINKGIEDEIPNLTIGRDLVGDIISLTYVGNTDYEDIMGSLPSTPLSNNSQNGDGNNTSVGLLDILKANSKNQVKAIEEQTKVLKANNLTQTDLVKNLALLNASIASLSTDSKDKLSSEKGFYTSSTLTNSKHNTKLDFETTGKVPIDKDKKSLQQLIAGIDGVGGSLTETLKDSQGDEIIPMHSKSIFYSETALEQSNLNKIDIQSFINTIEDVESDSESSNSLIDMFKEAIGITQKDIDDLDKLNSKYSEVPQ